MNIGRIRSPLIRRPLVVAAAILFAFVFVLAALGDLTRETIRLWLDMLAELRREDWQEVKEQIRKGWTGPANQ
jgi:hypothetical protein